MSRKSKTSPKPDKNKKLERLLKFYVHFRSLGYRQKTFAFKLNLTQPQFSRILRGQSGITKYLELALEKHYSLNIEWLNTGRGSMFSDTINENHLDKNSMKLIANFSKLNPEHKNMLLTFSEMLIDYPAQGTNRTEAPKIARR